MVTSQGDTAPKQDNDAPANLDFTIWGKRWELKSPGSGKHSVDDRLTDAFAKFKKLGMSEANVIICNSESTRADPEVLDECLKRVEQRRNRGAFDEINFIFLSHDGLNMRRYKF